MATSAVLTVDPTDLVLARTLEAFPDVRFECVRFVRTGDASNMPLMWARGAGLDDLEASLAADPSVIDAEILEDVGDERLYRMEWFDRVDVLLDMLTNEEATILDAHASNGAWNLRMLFPSRDHFNRTYGFCEDHGLSVDVGAIRDAEGEPTGRFGLTGSQYEALATATRMGYYRVPRESTLEEVAGELGVTHQSLSERLRRGHETLIQDVLMVESPPESA